MLKHSGVVVIILISLRLLGTLYAFIISYYVVI